VTSANCIVKSILGEGCQENKKKVVSKVTTGVTVDKILNFLLEFINLKYYQTDFVMQNMKVVRFWHLVVN